MDKVEHGSQCISRPALAKRWGVHPLTIRRRELAGLLTRSKGLSQRPVHYPMSEVLRLEAANSEVAR